MSLSEEREKLLAEVEKLKGDLAQKDEDPRPMLLNPTL